MKNGRPSKRTRTDDKKKGSGTKKNKKSSNKAPKTRALSNQAKKTLMGVLNPFSSSSDGVRLPDGAVTHSLPNKHRVTNEIKSVAGGASDIHVLLYANMHGGMSWTNVDPNTPGVTKLSNITSYRYSNAGEHQVADYEPTTGGSFEKVVINNAGDIAKWRNITTALKLTLTNQQERNDGWFEACRVNLVADMEHYNVGTTNSGDDLTAIWNNIQLLPNELLFANLDGQNLAEQPGYVVGSLRDIHKHQFQLSQVARDNEFLNQEEHYNMEHTASALDLSDFSAVAPADLWDTFNMQLEPGSRGGKAFFNATYDRAFDMVYIRIHPSTVAGATSNFIADLVCHQEIVYELNTTLQKYMLPAHVLSAQELAALQKVRLEANANASAMIE